MQASVRCREEADVVVVRLSSSAELYRSMPHPCMHVGVHCTPDTGSSPEPRGERSRYEAIIMLVMPRQAKLYAGSRKTWLIFRLGRVARVPSMSYSRLLSEHKNPPLNTYACPRGVQAWSLAACSC